MKVLLRSRMTGLYCADPEGWAAGSEQALDFTSIPRAARFARDEGLSGVEMVVRYHTVPDEVVVPILPEWCELDGPPRATAA
jgi:hypothetical protein